MLAKVIIKRRVPEEKKAKVLPLIIKLRTLATTKPGYIHGETLVNADDLEDLVVISTWENLDAWREWRINPERVAISDKIDALLEAEAECDTYVHGDIYLYSK